MKFNMVIINYSGNSSDRPAFFVSDKKFGFCVGKKRMIFGKKFFLVADKRRDPELLIRSIFIQ
ncbi:MAG: hypothetical protein BWY26_00953 [Elusimicrobia bacterium ADurb.Bin231]|nr:MAG: hypothetical protein BWY26_00953 [Elusimicrobia bacterium ADurb.Bin231]